MEEQKIQYALDFMTLTLELEKEFDINDKNRSSLYFANNKIKVIREILLSENYEIINFLLEYFNIGIEQMTQYINEIYVNEVHDKYSELNIKLHNFITWLNTNNQNLFFKIINSFITGKKINIFNYELIHKLKTIFDQYPDEDKTKKQFFDYITNKFIFNNYYYNHYYFYLDNEIFTNFEYIITVSEIIRKYSEYTKIKKINLSIFDIIFGNVHTNLKILLDYIKYIGLTEDEINTYLKTIGEEYFINFVLKTNSVEKIIWFFDNIDSYNKIISQSNYLSLFDNACYTKNVQIVKYMYSIIEMCGYKILNKDIEKILYRLVSMNDLNNCVIYELINFGIKPPKGYPKLTEYYKKLKIYS